MSLFNGHKGAISLTFDDGRVSQWKFAAPEMTKRGIYGTFFIVAENAAAEQFDPDFMKNGDLWAQIASFGHEIGSHSMTHAKAETLDEKKAEYEAHESIPTLTSYCSYKPVSYCYPYTDVNDALFSAVKRNYSQARGGRVARADKFYSPKDSINYHNLSCYHIGASSVGINTIPAIIQEALRRQCWVTLMFHTVGDGDEKAGVKPWDTVSEGDFIGLLDLLNIAKDAGLWVATFRDVAENLRANQK
jgi:peptidoglycan/xylan/chitin deacetylase (PgdA/CDA1 family)